MPLIEKSVKVSEFSGVRNSCRVVVLDVTNGPGGVVRSDLLVLCAEQTAVLVWCMSRGRSTDGNRQ
jgi:hypothetical protein